MNIAIGSHNPVKRHAAQRGFQLAFPTDDITVIGHDAPSGVSPQPMSEDETLTGARNRATFARKAVPEADYWVGIEGGLHPDGNELSCFAWVYIIGPDERVGKGRTGTFILPSRIASLVKAGTELGAADDIVFNDHNSKQKLGTVGRLTHGAIDRTEYYVPAVVFALIPFINPDLYATTD